MKLLIRILIGLLFIYSGVIKFISLESFELLIFNQLKFIPWLPSTILARSIVGVEILLGLLLCAKIYSKFTIKLSASILIIFNIYLVWLFIAKGNDENCGCFGEAITMSPIEGLLKNILLLVGLYFINKKPSIDFQFRSKLILSILTSLLILSLPFVIKPIYISMDDLYKEEIGKKLDLSNINIQKIEEKEVDLNKGKFLIAFFSTKCPHCKVAASKIDAIANNSDVQISRFYFFGKSKIDPVKNNESIAQFWVETKTKPIDYKVLVKKEFLEKGGINLPGLYLIKDGIIQQKLDQLALDKEVFKTFFKEQ